MQINLPQLESQLTKKLAPFYLLSGDETLLIQEAQEQIHTAAKKSDFNLRELVTVSGNFDWNHLYSFTENGNLFSDKTLLDVRNPQAKFDKKAQQFLHDYLADPNPDVILMISCGKLTAAQKKAKWYKFLSEQGICVSIWPIAAYELPKWIRQRLTKAGLNADTESIQLLADYTEGNLLATQQAITKLTLLQLNGKITADTVTKALHDNARFNVFDLGNFTLDGNAAKALRALEQLRLSGTEPTLILWTFSREIRLLHEIAHAKSSGGNALQLLNAQWKSRQTLLRKALQRSDVKTLERLIPMLHQADKVIKGMSKGNIWDLFSQLILALCTKHYTPVELPHE